jgi:hypothetical protein
MLMELDPAAQPAFTSFLKRLDEVIDDARYFVFEGRRSASVQEAYYAQGRERVAEVNAKRAAAGLYLLRNEKDNYIITWTLKSKHIDGLAMDVLPADGARNPTWDLAHFFGVFKIIRDCAFASGLVCGADWPSPNTDWPHYELKQ